MDFALSEEQTAIFEMARGFGEDRIAPYARTWESEGTMPRDLWPAQFYTRSQTNVAPCYTLPWIGIRALRL